MFPKGFFASGVYCGIKTKKKKDIALFYSARPAVGAGLLTANRVKAAPVIVSEAHLKKGGAFRAIVANSGCANACTGREGRRDAETMCALVAGHLGLEASEVLVASTGVIGQRLPLRNVERGIALLAGRAGNSEADARSAAEAIMTTDTFAKIVSRRVSLGGKAVTLWGCAKGSGMIHPDLRPLHATMLSFILTDAAISRKALAAGLATAVERTFNRVTVDGDTSTNDTVFALANGAAVNPRIGSSGSDYRCFGSALEELCRELAVMIARDGEGATRLVTVRVRNAASDAAAKKVAATVATSPLVKAAVFGRDANWGRIIAACGRAGVPIDPDTVDIYLGGLLVARRGAAAGFSEAKARKILGKKEVAVTIDLRQGKGAATYYTCDLTFDYIKINASYRS